MGVAASCGSTKAVAPRPSPADDEHPNAPSLVIDTTINTSSASASQQVHVSGLPLRVEIEQERRSSSDSSCRSGANNPLVGPHSASDNNTIRSLSAHSSVSWSYVSTTSSTTGTPKSSLGRRSLTGALAEFEPMPAVLFHDEDRRESRESADVPDVPGEDESNRPMDLAPLGNIVGHRQTYSTSSLYGAADPDMVFSPESVGTYRPGSRSAMSFQSGDVHVQDE